MSRRARESASQRNGAASTRRRWALALGLAAVAAGLAYAALCGTAGSHYRSARRLADTDPETALQLSERAILQADNSYPAAELLSCRLFARLGRWPEALGGFSLIRAPERCDPAELLDLAERASAARETTLASMAAGAARRNASVFADALLLRRLVALDESLASASIVLSECDALARLAPDDWAPWAVRARVEKRRGKLDASATALRSALHRGPPKSEADALRLELVDRCLDQGQAAEARRVLDSLLDSGPPGRERLLRQAYLCRVEGKPSEAVAAADEALRLSPDWGPALLIRGILRLDAADAAGAVADLERVVQLEPFRKEAHHKLGLALIQTGQADLGREHLARSRDLTAWTTAIVELEEQTAGAPRTAETLRTLADLNARVGRADQAELYRRQAASTRGGK